jgi:hypothetical protein
VCIQDMGIFALGVGDKCLHRIMQTVSEFSDDYMCLLFLS